MPQSFEDTLRNAPRATFWIPTLHLPRYGQPDNPTFVFNKFQVDPTPGSTLYLDPQTDTRAFPWVHFHEVGPWNADELPGEVVGTEDEQIRLKRFVGAAIMRRTVDGHPAPFYFLRPNQRKSR